VELPSRRLAARISYRTLDQDVSLHRAPLGLSSVDGRRLSETLV
jgi:hypothetical protein